MTDNSNNQNHTEGGWPNDPRDKKIHETDHNTYWEKPLNISEIEQPGNPSQFSGTSRSLDKAPEQSVQQSEQPFQQENKRISYRSYMNALSDQPSEPSDDRISKERPDEYNVTGSPQKKKSHPVLATIAVTLVILAAVTGTAYAFRDIIINRLALMTMSPTNYYAYVEKNNVSFILDTITEAGAFRIPEAASGYAYDFTADVSVNHETIDSLMTSYLGTSLTDAESLLGIPFNSINLKALIGVDGALVNETLGLSLNNIKLITTDLFVNSDSKEAFLRLPELSPAYLALTDKGSKTSPTSVQEAMSPERNKELMKRYSSLIIDHISRVTIGEDKELSLEHLSKNCTTLTVVMTADDLYDIEMDVLKAAREDTYIKELLPVLQITEEQYQQFLDKLQTECESSRDTLETLTMTVYVDARGMILGRSITSEDSVAAVGYTILYDNTAALEYNFFLTDDTGATVCDLTGNQKKVNGADYGKAEVTIAGLKTDASLFRLDISYEGLHKEHSGNRSYQYGTLTLSSLDFKGIQAIMDFSAKEDSQLCDIDFRLGAESLAMIHTKTAYRENFTAAFPSADADIYQMTDLEAYVSTFRLKDYITSLSDQFGVDFQSLFQLYQNGFIN